jgi:hypothetical protein
MLELIAMVVIGYFALTLGVAALIGKGHGPRQPTAVGLGHGRQRRITRPARHLGIGWDATTSESASHDAFGWDLAA